MVFSLKLLQRKRWWFYTKKRKVSHILNGWLCSWWFICWSWFMWELCVRWLLQWPELKLSIITCIQSNSQYYVRVHLQYTKKLDQNHHKENKSVTLTLKIWQLFCFQTIYRVTMALALAGIQHGKVLCLSLFSMIATVREFRTDLRYDCFWILSSISVFVCQSCFSSIYDLIILSFSASLHIISPTYSFFLFSQGKYLLTANIC